MEDVKDINKNTNLKHRKMENKSIMWIIIGILLVAVVFLTYKASTLTGNAVVNNEKLDTSGWTENEKMNYEMHGTVPARISGGSTPAGSGMVGGC